MALELVEKIRRYIEENSLIEAGDKVLAAVSEGLDSMVLVELLHRLSGPLEFTLSVASFDHGLRGASVSVRLGRQESSGGLVRGKHSESSEDCAIRIFTRLRPENRMQPDCHRPPP